MTETDPTKIKAGKYVLTCLRWDEITSKPGEPFDFVRHHKGDEVDLNVEQARRLVLAGAAAKRGDVDEEPAVPGSEPATAPGGGSEDSGSGAGKPTPIKKLLEDIGGDKTLAQVALDEENAQEKPRPSLVEKLQAIIDAE